jgi:hypothetical protein
MLLGSGTLHPPPPPDEGGLLQSTLLFEQMQDDNPNGSQLSLLEHIPAFETQDC